MGFGPKGIEDVAFWPIAKSPAATGQYIGNTAGLTSVADSMIPVFVMNRDTGVISERALTESVYWSSISYTGFVAGYFPIWDFEVEAPDPTTETILLKIASGIVDIAAAKLAPPAALLARALDRAAVQAAGGVSSLAVIRALMVDMGGVRWQMTISGTPIGVGNGGGARPGWPRLGSSSFGYGVPVSANAKLSMGYNQVAATYPFFDDMDGFSRIYEGFFSGQPVAQTGNYWHQALQGLFPLAMTPGEVLNIAPALDPSQAAGQIPATPQPASVAICWSEFAVAEA